MIFYLMSLFIIPSKRILAVYIRSAKKVIFKKLFSVFQWHVYYPEATYLKDY